MCSDSRQVDCSDALGSASAIVSLREVSKQYDRQPRKIQWAAMLGRETEPRMAHRALDEVDLDVRSGEAVAVIGRNGAGKSTLLKIVAGVTQPDRGSVSVGGSIGAMIELGVGFHPDLTGRENIYCSLVMHGLSPGDIEAATPAVTEFSGIGDAIDTPVKHYSLGMRARLGFAVATHRRPDVLLVDEILAVGDRQFQQRCLERIAHMIDQGTSLLFVTHQMSLVASVCHRAIRLEEGRVVDDGVANEVVERYLTSARLRPSTDGTESAVIAGITLPATISPRDPLHLEAEIEVREPVREPHLRLDLSLPVIAPDVVAVSSRVALADLGQPGRFRVSGTTSPIAAEGVRYRATLCVTDRADRVISNEVSAEFVVTGGEVGTVPRFSGEAHATITAVETGARDATPLRTERRPHPAVNVAGVTKSFAVGHPRAELARALPWRHPIGTLTALDDLTLEVARGEAVGLIGPNGAGKSTLLRLVAGLSAPDSGTIEVEGSVVPMLGLGVRLHRDFTGSENIDIIGGLLGMGPEVLQREREGILAMAGLGDAIDAPVRQYSSGMEARLALALSMFCPGDVLLIDELLSVGDEQFRNDSMDAIRRRHAQGDTVIFVSHELQLIEDLCDRVVWLRNGSLVDDDDTASVLERYGHKSWAAGVHDATSAARLRALSVTRRHIDTGGSLEFSGQLVLDESFPTGRLEVSYRLAPEDRHQPLTIEQRMDRTVFVATMVRSGGQLARAGTYEYRARVDHNDWVGEVDLVVSMIDERSNEVITETYEPVTVGRSTGQGFPMLVVTTDWTSDRLDGSMSG